MALSPATLTLELPEPPSLNRMIDLAKQRTRRSRTGGWMKRALPVVYDQALEAYEIACLAQLRAAQVPLPRAPWSRWEIVSAHFRLHGQRDLVELNAGLKWPVDVLVRCGVVSDDSPDELVRVAQPTQEIARSNRGITLTIRQVEP